MQTSTQGSGSANEQGVKKGYRLGRISGIEIVADLSLLVLGVLLVASLFADLARVSPGTSRETVLIASLIGGMVFIGSVLGHELSHSLLAQRRGLPVRRIRLFIFGGVSEIEREASNPRDEFVIAMAGPLSSGLFGAALWLVTLAIPGSLVIAVRLGRVLAIVNLLLAAFNLLPGFPLDGGRVLRALLWRRGDKQRATKRAIASGRVLALGLIGVGAWLLLRRMDISGLWTIAVGGFLYKAALEASAREALLVRIDGRSVADIMRPVAASVPGDASVAEVVALHQVGPSLQPVPVVVEGRVRGVVAEEEIAALSNMDRMVILVTDVMSPIGPKDVVSADEPLDVFLARPAASSGRVLAVEDGRVVGLVTGREMSTVFG